MFKTKKDIDRHVRANLAKLNENEKKYRGFTIAKLYFKINEFETAANYVSEYLSVYHEKPGAYKLLGQCMLQLNKKDKALEAFQRSLQLDAKQPDIITEVCKLLLEKDSLDDCNADYWCNLAEIENIQDNTVFDLRLKLSEQNKMSTEAIENRIKNDINNKPYDANLRVHYIQYLIEQNKIIEGFKYALGVELNRHENQFLLPFQWYENVSILLKKLKPLIEITRDWEYLLLQTLCYEKQLQLSFSDLNSSDSFKTEELLFQFDQQLNEVAIRIDGLLNADVKDEFLKHFRGQLCFYMAATLFKNEINDNINWRETIKKSLPFLLFAYQIKPPDITQHWVKNLNKHNKSLISLFRAEGSFRCSQAGHTILSCAKKIFKSTKVITEFKWKNSIEILNEIREFCSNSKWRSNLYKELFCNNLENINKITNSYFVNCPELINPALNFPSSNELQNYDEISFNFDSFCLSRMTYLLLEEENMIKSDIKPLKCKNFSTNNLSNTGAETLNELDIDSFLIASAIQAKRQLEIQVNNLELFQQKNSSFRPLILPYINIQSMISTDKQSNWWKLAYNTCNNITDGNLGDVRSNLKFGIEVIRGLNEQKIDLIVLLKLAKILSQRGNNITKTNRKNLVDARVLHLYKKGLQILKKGNHKSLSESAKPLFSYPAGNTSFYEKEINSLTDDAIKFMVSYYFEQSEYEECINLLSGLNQPLAKYYINEANENLDKSGSNIGHESFSNKTLNKSILSDLHNDSNSDRDNSFANLSKSYNDKKSNKNTENMLNKSSQITQNSNTTSISDTLINQIADTLSFLKIEVIDFVRPELQAMRKDITTLKEKINVLEDKINKEKAPTAVPQPTPHPSQIDLNDYLFMAAANNMQNALYSSQAGHQSPFGIQTGLENSPHQQLQSSLQQQLLNTYKSPLFNHPAFMPLNNFPQYGTPPNPTQQQTPLQQQARPGQPSSFQRVNQMNPQWMLGNQQLGYENFNNPAALPPNSELDSHKINEYLSLINQNQNRMFPAAPKPTPSLNVTPLAPQHQPQPSLQTTPSLQSNIWGDAGLYNTPPSNVDKTIQQVIDDLPVTIPTENIPTLNNPANPLFPSKSFTFSSTFNTATNVASNNPTSTSLFGTGTSPLTFGTSSLFANKGNNDKKDKSGTNLDDTSKSSDFESKDEIEYDPRPDFQPIIPLPAEVPINTGEENEEIVFQSKAKLFRFVEKEWKERGTGEIKILKSKDDGKGRILMRRDLTHKICANHKITGEMNLVQPSTKKEEKAYIWAAQDYADEELKVEKFCIRFKQVEDAKGFFNAFNKIRDEAKFDESKSSENDKNIKTNKESSTKPVAASKESTKEPQKSALFSFKFDANPNPTKPKEDKPSPFANLNLMGSTSLHITPNKPFESLLNSLNKTPTPNITLSTDTAVTTQKLNFDTPKTTTTNENLDKSGAGEAEADEFVPTAQFKPVIALPDLVSVETGEENENIIFEHRAKILRYDKVASEWKERGLGNIKILQDRTDPSKVRLVMRREKVQKLCCNQNILKETKFIYPKNAKLKNSLIWVGIDYSENELVTETFSIKFKTEETCTTFYNHILKLQETMNKKDDKPAPASKETQENKVTTGFGDMFKPKTGSWSCKDCYIQNNSDASVCVACNAPKDGKKENQNPIENKPQTAFQGFGDMFKPKTGSWNCNSCYIQNNADAVTCIACNTSKDGTTNTSTQNSAKTSNISGFGDMFKPKEGSWSCKECYVQNSSTNNNCLACNASKDGTTKNDSIQKPTIFGGNSTDSPKFTFGFNNDTTKTSVFAQNPQPTSFNFGFNNITSSVSDNITTFTTTITTTTTLATAVTTTTASSTFDFNLQTPAFGSSTLPSITNIFSQKSPFAATPLFSTSTTISNSAITSSTEDSKENEPKTNGLSIQNNPISKSSPIPFTFGSLGAKFDPQPKTPTNEEADDGFSFGKKNFTFNFNNKPTKSPGKIKSPAKLTTSNDDTAEISGEEYEEEENNAYFTPVVHLEKVDVKTGEEDEETLYCHRAKLFRFIDKEWKERGLGDVKILKHKIKNTLRVIMRREKIHKICLNHILNPEVEYKRKDDKSWMFAVNDFSEGELEPMNFCLRFKTSEIADNFMEEINKATNSNLDKTEQSATDIQKSDDDKTIENKNDNNNSHDGCAGCIGCDPDKYIFDQLKLEDDVKPLPLQLDAVVKLKKDSPNKDKKNSSFLKQSTLNTSTSEANKSITEKDPLKDDSINNNSENQNQSGVFNTFSFKLDEDDKNKNSPFSGSLFKGSIFGGGNNNNTANTGGTNGFEFGKTSLFNQSSNKNIFATGNDSGQGEVKSIFGGSTFGQSSAFNSFSFASAFNNENNKTEEDKNKNPITSFIEGEKSVSNSSAAPIFKTDDIDFASLAKSATTNQINSTESNKQPGQFFGLTQEDSFKNFLKPKQDNNGNDSINKSQGDNANDSHGDDANFDPYYKPVIDLPNEIVVSTGEEEETKLFGERAKLFRYDDTNKEWKERGVGEMKILYHPQKNTYRILMRREQIHKLVLNHAIGADFDIKSMNNSPKEFCWGAMNYYEDEPKLEKLALRFKNADLAKKFQDTINECITKCKNSSK